MEYQLDINENDNNIHSSMDKGFHKVLWNTEIVSDDSVSFFYHSPDMENGFPGNPDDCVHGSSGSAILWRNTTRDIVGKDGILITKNSGFCMESHYYPNSINIPWFPQPILEKGAEYETTTIYQFSIGA